MNMMNIGNTAVVGMLCLWLGGCGHVNAAGVKPAGSVAARAIGTSVAELAAHAEDAAYEGKQVSVEASFDRYDYTLGYGRSFQGYRLWDRAGHWLLCQNVYASRSVYPNSAPDLAQDLTAAAAGRLLAYGTFVPLTGVFHTQTTSASHGGVYTTPAGLALETMPRKPSPCSPTVPAALAASTAALSLAASASTGVASNASAAATMAIRFLRVIFSVLQIRRGRDSAGWRSGLPCPASRAHRHPAWRRC